MTITVSGPYTSAAPAPVRGVLAPRLAQGLVLAMVLIAGAAGFLAADGAASAKAASLAGEDLTRLLRAMAAIKAAMALGVTAGVVWRLGEPARTPWLAGYVVACAAMAVGPGLIWNMTQLPMGAALLHGGLLVAAVMLWRDPAVGRRLSLAVARRRAARR